MSFAVTVMTTFFTLERGRYDDLGPAIVFEGEELLPGFGSPIRYHRTVTFVDDDSYTMGISYPDHPDSTFGRMFVEHRRA